MNAKAIYHDKIRCNFICTANIQSQLWKLLILIIFTSLVHLGATEKCLQQHKEMLTFSASKDD